MTEFSEITQVQFPRLAPSAVSESITSVSVVSSKKEINRDLEIRCTPPLRFDIRGVAQFDDESELSEFKMSDIHCKLSRRVSCISNIPKARESEKKYVFPPMEQVTYSDRRVKARYESAPNHSLYFSGTGNGLNSSQSIIIAKDNGNTSAMTQKTTGLINPSGLSYDELSPSSISKSFSAAEHIGNSISSEDSTATEYHKRSTTLENLFQHPTTPVIQPQLLQPPAAAVTGLVAISESSGTNTPAFHSPMNRDLPVVLGSIASPLRPQAIRRTISNSSAADTASPASSKASPVVPRSPFTARIAALAAGTSGSQGVAQSLPVPKYVKGTFLKLIMGTPNHYHRHTIAIVKVAQDIHFSDVFACVHLLADVLSEGESFVLLRDTITINVLDVVAPLEMFRVAPGSPVYEHMRMELSLIQEIAGCESDSFDGWKLTCPLEVYSLSEPTLAV